MASKRKAEDEAEDAAVDAKRAPEDVKEREESEDEDDDERPMVKFAVSCSSNQNRSMEAHCFLQYVAPRFHSLTNFQEARLQCEVVWEWKESANSGAVDRQAQYLRVRTGNLCRNPC